MLKPFAGRHGRPGSFTAALAALLAAGALCPVRAEIPRTIPLQGMLTDTSGNPKPNGSHTLTFRLYDPVQGTSTATQEHHTFTGSTIVLDNKPVLPDTVSMVKADGSITYTPNTAFSIDYPNGVITRASAAIIPDGTGVKVTYQHAGTMLWQETKPVTVSKGLFSTVLGSSTAIPASVAFDGPYVLEVQAQGEARPMRPRMTLSSVPYALRAAGLALPSGGTAAVEAPGAAFSATNTGTGAALAGTSSDGSGVEGHTSRLYGVYGKATGTGFAGVAGIGFGSPTGYGVYGMTNNGGTGVGGYSEGTGPGVWARSLFGYGIHAETSSAKAAVHGVNGGQGGGAGVEGLSDSFNGVIGRSSAAGHAGVAGVSNGAQPGNGLYGISQNGGSGVFAIITGGGSAVRAEIGTNTGAFGEGSLFEGHSVGRVFRVDRYGRVYANGNFQASGADVAEFIPSPDDLRPGDVVEIDPERDGQFRRSRAAESTRVAGVISTLPGVSMGAVMPADGTNAGPQLALVGRVPVQASAEGGPIRRGDLLTSAATPGCAMRAPESPKPGTIIGKALGALSEGRGTLMMLVMLR